MDRQEQIDRLGDLRAALEGCLKLTVGLPAELGDAVTSVYRMAAQYEIDMARGWNSDRRPLAGKDAQASLGAHDRYK
jgi:hypothetical protein